MLLFLMLLPVWLLLRVFVVFLVFILLLFFFLVLIIFLFIRVIIPAKPPRTVLFFVLLHRGFLNETMLFFLMLLPVWLLLRVFFVFLVFVLVLFFVPVLIFFLITRVVLSAEPPRTLLFFVLLHRVLLNEN